LTITAHDSNIIYMFVNISIFSGIFTMEICDKSETFPTALPLRWRASTPRDGIVRNRTEQEPFPGCYFIPAIECLRGDSLRPAADV
jgi:hypothetical protein